MSEFIETINEMLNADYFPIIFLILLTLWAIIALIITNNNHEGE